MLYWPRRDKCFIIIILNSHPSRPPRRTHRMRYTPHQLHQPFLRRHCTLLFSNFHATSNISTFLPRMLALPSNSHFHSLLTIRSTKANIVVVSMCPGRSRSDTIAPLFNAVRARYQSMFGIVLYILLQPFLRLPTKSMTSAIQSILHVLFSQCLSRATLATGQMLQDELWKQAHSTMLRDWGRVSGTGDVRSERTWTRKTIRWLGVMMECQLIPRAVIWQWLVGDITLLGYHRSIPMEYPALSNINHYCDIANCYDLYHWMCTTW